MKINALFIGINKYKDSKIRDLGGCENDVRDFSNYIKEAVAANNWKLNAKKLIDEDAGKKNIEKQFLCHLGKAKKDEICLLYFSGHGGQEKAHDAFIPHESDGKLEVLVCHDSEIENSESFIADKDLRYLIRKLYENTQARIITIFDCCNSGENVRSMKKIRRLFRSGQKRDWSGFIFHDKINETEVKEAQVLDDVLPQGHYLHMAACLDKESAYEIGGHGIFTSALISLLKQTKGSISYFNLVSLLRLKLIGKDNSQTPVLSAYGNEDLKFESFLGGITRHQKDKGNIIFNTTQQYWYLDTGAIHGIDLKNENLKICLADEEGNDIKELKPKRVLLDATILETGDTRGLDISKSYPVNVSGFVMGDLKIFLKGEGEAINVFRDEIEKLDSVGLTPLVSEADYILEYENEKFYLLNPYNLKPVVKQTLFNKGKGIPKMIGYIEHISRWTFYRNLRNPSAREKDFPNLELDIKVENNMGDFNPIEFDKFDAKLTFSNKKKRKGKMQIELKNKSYSSQFCSLFCFNQDFGLLTKLIGDGVKEIISKKSVKIYGGKSISFKMSDYIHEFNWEKETIYLLLIASRNMFDVAGLGLEALPHPYLEGTRSYSRRSGSVGFENHTYFPYWQTRLYTLTMDNRDFQKEEVPRRLVYA